MCVILQLALFIWNNGAGIPLTDADFLCGYQRHDSVNSACSAWLSTNFPICVSSSMSVSIILLSSGVTFVICCIACCTGCSKKYNNMTNYVSKISFWNSKQLLGKLKKNLFCCTMYNAPTFFSWPSVLRSVRCSVASVLSIYCVVLSSISFVRFCLLLSNA